MSRIVAVEPVFANMSHAPGNGSFLALLADATPGTPIEFLAAREHGTETLARLDAFHGGRRPPSLSYREIPAPPSTKDPMGRFRWAFSLFRRTIARQPPGPVLLTLLYGDGPAIAAADLVAAIAGRRHQVSTAYRLHGDLVEIMGWRSRNPLLRMIDMRGSLGRRRSSRSRVIALEHFIADALVAELPALRGRVAVIPEPVHDHSAATPPHPPVVVGYLGLMTQAKGYDVFASLAAELKPQAAGRLSFRVAGALHPSMRDIDPSGIDDPVSSAPLDRSTFEARVRSLHYACLPYQGDYYKWASSAVLLDAIGFGVPVIALKSPSTVRLFETYGACGYLCDDVSVMRDVMKRLMNDGLPEEEHARHRRAMAAAREERSSGQVLERMKQGLALLTA